MQVYPNRFEQHIAQNGLPPFIMVFGDEPQQKLDIIDAVRAKAKGLGFDERQTLVADSDFSWSQLIDATQSMSLFSDKQYIELTLPTGKPGAEGAKVLSAICDSISPDTIILIQGPKIGKDVQKAKWFKTIDAHAIFSLCYPLEGKQLLQWVTQRCKEQKINLSQASINLICDFSEGNLLAAKQEIEKLSLLYSGSNQAIDADALAKSMVDQSRFTVFQFVDDLLAGDIQKAIKILYRLESEGVEPNVILWSLIKEAQTLAECKSMQRIEGTVNFNKLRIWQNKQTLYRSALQRLNDKDLRLMMEHLQQADLILKSEQSPKPFVLISHLACLFIPAPLQHLALR
ncbi:DNA polymerase III subunit delta [Glaciecola sp. MH2013]|uniref:DNA polymerase III subunit delta n=1 Tax=Glaciecola sp. MH2013 TaxID=2785524 RepID=UPI00189C7740|nr:DNA polymerase III subunit delta [Glaciecola sp. MH2013]MBF7072629.1 DNA polymerase III subunit delta [Glaciecola sp. MH2013]